MALCNSTRECIEQTGQLKFCYNKRESFNNQSNCDCAVLIGWVGEDCDEISPVLIYNRIFHFILLAWVLVLAVLNLRTLILSTHSKMVTSTFWNPDSNYLATLTLFIACISFSTHHTLRIPSYFDHNHIEFFVVDSVLISSKEDIEPKHNFAQLTFIYCAVACTQMTNILILFSLNEMVRSLARFTVLPLQVSCCSWKRILILFAIMYLALILSLVIFGNSADGDYIGVLVTFTLSFIFPMVSFRFVRILRHLGHEDEGLRETSWLVKVTGIAISINHLLVSIILLANQMDNRSYEVDAEFGEFNRSLALTDTFLVLAGTMLTIDSWYLNSISEGPILAEYYPHIYCCWFSLWDAENKRLIPSEAPSTIKSFSVFSQGNDRSLEN